MPSCGLNAPKVRHTAVSDMAASADPSSELLAQGP